MISLFKPSDMFVKVEPPQLELLEAYDSVLVLAHQPFDLFVIKPSDIGLQKAEVLPQIWDLHVFGILISATD